MKTGAVPKPAPPVDNLISAFFVFTGQIEIDEIWLRALKVSSYNALKE